MSRADLARTSCSAARTIELFGDAWTLMILRELFLGARRFDDLQRQTGAAPHILSQRLKRLEATGVLRREAYSERPPRHEYRLTAMGRDLWPVVVAMKAWGDTWLDDGASSGATSGATAVALEDVIALVGGLEAHPGDLPAGLAAYEAARRPVVEKLVRAAGESAAWYEDFGSHMKLAPLDFAYSYITRSGRIDDDRLRAVAPQFMAQYAAWKTTGGA